MSDERGQFRFLGLDPGSWALEARLDGFSMVEYPAIDIRVAANTRVEIQLPAVVEEVVTVTSESPLLDERKIAQGTLLRQIDLEVIPTARDPWAVMNQAAGVMVDRINVGGNESGLQSRFRTQASETVDNDFIIDGVQITDMAAVGGSPTYYDFDQFSQIDLSTGGSEITKNTPGLSINMVTKRGSNEFRGSARFLLTDSKGYFGVLEQAEPSFSESDLGDGQTDFVGNTVNVIQDFGFEAGGPSGATGSGFGPPGVKTTSISTRVPGVPTALFSRTCRSSSMPSSRPPTRLSARSTTVTRGWSVGGRIRPGISRRPGTSVVPLE